MQGPQEKKEGLDAEGDAETLSRRVDAQDFRHEDGPNSRYLGVHSAARRLSAHLGVFHLFLDYSTRKGTPHSLER
jgi:hypothetical protein